MLYVLPQLPVKNRYTEDWISVWSRELRLLKKDFRILGDIEISAPLTKYFTNPVEALKYECNQISDLIKFASPHDKIFCLDTDFPGLLSAAIPVLKLVNPDLKFYGYLHAGSWCDGDIFEGNAGKSWMERALLDIFDKIFVATNYHKEKIQRYLTWMDDYYHMTRFDDIEVVGFPFYKEDVYRYVKPLPYDKKDIILINGRREQSNMGLISKISNSFRNRLVTVALVESRADYYKALNQAKIVISLKTEETFGIGQLEAHVLGSIPLCPNKFAYPETIGDERLLYNDEKDLMDKLDYLLTLKENLFKIDIEKYRHTIAKCMSFVDEK